jgi:hypothetical protein
MSADGLAWRPHSNPTFAALDIVELPDSDPAKRGALDAEATMRSPGRGPRLPPIRFVFVRGLEHINGATEKGWSPGEAIVVLRAGRTYGETFRTACHEVAHLFDRTRGFTDQVRESRAAAASESAAREMGVRWR